MFENIVFQTVISGVLVFLIGETIQRFILEPLKEYKMVIGKIDNKLKYYSKMLTSSNLPVNALIEIMAVFRELSCELESTYKQIPIRDIFTLFHIIEAHNDISEAAKGLIYLSNAGGKEKREENNRLEIEKIRKNLRIANL